VKNNKKTSKLGRLEKRAEFLSVRAGEKRRGPLFLLETRKYEDSEEHGRFGLTVSKKCGNAVVRNRIRRRLGEAMRLHAAVDMEAQSDYVIVARRDVLNAPFLVLANELKRRIRGNKHRKPDAE
jgi:ribonuclease P protein component